MDPRTEHLISAYVEESAKYRQHAERLGGLKNERTLLLDELSPMEDDATQEAAMLLAAEKAKDSKVANNDKTRAARAFQLLRANADYQNLHRRIVKLDAEIQQLDDIMKGLDRELRSTSNVLYFRASENFKTADQAAQPMMRQQATALAGRMTQEQHHLN